jgi:hypothetical protein
MAISFAACLMLAPLGAATQANAQTPTPNPAPFTEVLQGIPGEFSFTLIRLRANGVNIQLDANESEEDLATRVCRTLAYTGGPKFYELTPIRRRSNATPWARDLAT